VPESKFLDSERYAPAVNAYPGYHLPVVYINESGERVVRAMKVWPLLNN
jgi:hypothetical protein